MRAAVILVARQIGALNAGASLAPKTLTDLPAYG
jgi:hypothetical protein